MQGGALRPRVRVPGVAAVTLRALAIGGGVVAGSGGCWREYDGGSGDAVTRRWSMVVRRVAAAQEGPRLGVPASEKLDVVGVCGLSLGPVGGACECRGRRVKKPPSAQGVVA